MISIIICSVSSNLLGQLRENIKNTIGVDFELLVENNASTRNGICHVYNELVKKAQHKYLLFIHEDIIFHTHNWGMNLINHLKNDSIGIVGISGAISKSAFPSSWTATQSSSYRINAIQHFKENHHIKSIQVNPNKEIISEVVCVDGVFLATRKEIMYEHPFDDKLLNGFHGYDLDISLRVGQFHKVMVAHDIVVEHFSEGNLNKNWLSDMILVHKKWNKILPKQISYDIDELKMTNYISLKEYLLNLIRYKFPRSIVLKVYSKLLVIYFGYNKFDFTKTVFRYIIFNVSL